MSRIAYVGGQYLPHRQAAVHIEDRGFQFADGVYEVIAVVGGYLVDEERHLVRLRRSLSELRIDMPMEERALKVVMREVIRRNGVVDGIVYVQVTRGVAPREHGFPRAAEPVLVVTARRKRTTDPRLSTQGVAVITIPDIRWQRCDIKSVALVANVLGKQQAREAGAYEAWQVDREGQVTEGTSTNAWIVTADNAVVTRAADHAILNGVTRAYFEAESKIMSGQTAEDMRAILKTPPDPAAVKRLSESSEYNSTLRTTCVATRLDAGHANNALPQRAQAIVNCRILPGHSKEEVRQDIIRVLDSPKITVQYVGDGGEGQAVVAGIDRLRTGNLFLFLVDETDRV